MNMEFNVEKVFQKCLATSMGLDRYSFIMGNLHKMDVSNNKKF